MVKDLQLAKYNIKNENDPKVKLENLEAGKAIFMT